MTRRRAKVASFEELLNDRIDNTGERQLSRYPQFACDRLCPFEPQNKGDQGPPPPPEQQ